MFSHSKIFLIFNLFLTGCLTLGAQQAIFIQGIICDANSKDGIAGASVELTSGQTKTRTDADGRFSIQIAQNSETEITIKHPEFLDYTSSITPNKGFLHIHLQPKTIVLHTMTVTAQSKHTLPETASSSISVNRSFFQKTNASTLSASLAKLPGVTSMDIGAGLSKPVIRGMSFNRMAVVDKGIVIQNQQWGADHGLELDQLDVDRLIVRKGAMSLYYGSDAIAGVVEILPAEAPSYNLIWGDATLTAKSNNSLLGASVGLNSKSGNWFYQMRATALNYGDYRIPADTIVYLTWKMPLENRRMKNTAGREYNLSGSVKYEKNDFNTAIYISNNNLKSGFFPCAHGIPDLRRLGFDGSYRNIELPYSTVNHFKISNTAKFPLFTNWSVHTDIGYQINLRSEMALFHTHFPNQPAPEENSEMELGFSLQTFSGNIRLHNTDNRYWEKTFGFSAEYQTNQIAGYSFLIPDFRRITSGIFGAANYKPNENWRFIGGIRLDWGKVSTRGFYDSVLEEYFLASGYNQAIAAYYAQRANALQLNFANISGSAGFIYKYSPAHLFKANLGRSFRFPTPNELASNGVHHGAFRYERGNPELKPETGLQLDVAYEYNKRKWRIAVSPFANYFENYIFLNPTGQWALLPHTGQQYEYTQSKAWMAGGEIEAYYQALPFLQLASNIEYVYTLNLVSGYPLSFSPPVHWTSNAVFSAHAGKLLTHYTVNVEAQKVFAQNNIANNEDKTPGAWLFNLSASLNWKMGKQRIVNELQIYNLFDTAYLNHLSYYRKLNAPEPGRNIQLLLKVPF